MRKVYQVWEAPDHSEISMGDLKSIHDQKVKQLIGDDWIMLHQFWASGYNESMTTYYELMGWKPYVPYWEDNE